MDWRIIAGLSTKHGPQLGLYYTALVTHTLKKRTLLFNQ